MYELLTLKRIIEIKKGKELENQDKLYNSWDNIGFSYSDGKLDALNEILEEIKKVIDINYHYLYN